MLTNNQTAHPNICSFTLLQIQHGELGPQLTGEQGLYRYDGHNQLGASNDLEAMAMFLKEYRGVPATYRAYQKEIERLLLWSILTLHKPISSLNRDDYTQYIQFLFNPQPSEIWCASQKQTRHSAQWRPFLGPLSPKAVQHALAAIQSLLSYWVDAHYITANPLALVRQKHQLHVNTITEKYRIEERVFTTLQFDAIVHTIHQSDILIGGTVRTHARAKWLVSLLYFLALRLNEVASHNMSHFKQRRGLWFFDVVGKGSKAASIPVNQSLIENMIAFRRAFGLTDLPSEHETFPLIPTCESHQALSARRIAQIVEEIIQTASTHLASKHPQEAENMLRASPHWFRHTSITHQAQLGIPLHELKNNARHTRSDTTLLYVHTDQNMQHERLQQWMFIK